MTLDQADRRREPLAFTRASITFTRKTPKPRLSARLRIKHSWLGQARRSVSPILLDGRTPSMQWLWGDCTQFAGSGLKGGFELLSSAVPSFTASSVLSRRSTQAMFAPGTRWPYTSTVT